MMASLMGFIETRDYKLARAARSLLPITSVQRSPRNAQGTRRQWALELQNDENKGLMPVPDGILFALRLCGILCFEVIHGDGQERHSLRGPQSAECPWIHCHCHCDASSWHRGQYGHVQRGECGAVE